MLKFGPYYFQAVFTSGTPTVTNIFLPIRNQAGVKLNTCTLLDTSGTDIILVASMNAPTSNTDYSQPIISAVNTGFLWLGDEIIIVPEFIAGKFKAVM